jgi:hypothetical protein
VASQQSLVLSEAHKFKKYKLATESYEHAMQAAYQTPTGINGADDATQSASSAQQGLAKQPSLLEAVSVVGLALAIWCMRRKNQQGQIAAMVPMDMGSGSSSKGMVSRGSYQDLLAASASLLQDGDDEDDDEDDEEEPAGEDIGLPVDDVDVV